MKTLFIKISNKNKNIFTKLFLLGKRNILYASYKEGKFRIKFECQLGRSGEIYFIRCCELISYGENKTTHLKPTCTWIRNGDIRNFKDVESEREKFLQHILNLILDFVHTGDENYLIDINLFHSGICPNCKSPLRNKEELVNGIHKKCDEKIIHQYSLF